MPEPAHFCGNCGAPVVMEGERFCVRCGTPIAPVAAPWPAPAAAAPPATKRAARRSLVVGGSLVLVGLLAAALLVLTGGGSDEPEGEILLEPVAFRGDDPFTGDVDDHNRGGSPTTAPRTW